MIDEVNSYLQQMSATAGETLAAGTQMALEAEQRTIGLDLEKTLHCNTVQLCNKKTVTYYT